MRTSHTVFPSKPFTAIRGITLVELLIFIVIISVALVTFLSVFGFQVANSVDPAARVRALERGQAVLDEILSRKFDENTPTGGVPACNSSGAPACSTMTADADFDDVADYSGFTDTTDPNYPVSVQVMEAGDELPGGASGLSPEHARLITVTVSIPGGETLSLSAYRANF